LSETPDAFTPHCTLRDQVERLVAYLRCGKNVSPQIVIGPVVWEPKDEGRFWHFVVATGDGDGAHFDQLGSPERHLAEELRTALFLALLEERSIVLHDLDDELQMARLCEGLWPSEKASRVRAGIEAEQAAARGRVQR
jgi:hypothetical protein